MANTSLDQRGRFRLILFSFHNLSSLGSQFIGKSTSFISNLPPTARFEIHNHTCRQVVFPLDFRWFKLV